MDNVLDVDIVLAAAADKDPSGASRLEKIVADINQLSPGVARAFLIPATEDAEQKAGPVQRAFELGLQKTLSCGDAPSTGEWLLARALSFESNHWEFLPEHNRKALLYTEEHHQKLTAIVGAFGINKMCSDFYLWQISLRRPLQAFDKRARDCLNVLAYLIDRTTDLSQTRFRRACFEGDRLCLFLLCSDPSRQVLLTGKGQDDQSLRSKQENCCRKIVLVEQLLKDCIERSPVWYALNRIIDVNVGTLSDLAKRSANPALVGRSNKNHESAVRKLFLNGDLMSFFGPDAEEYQSRSSKPLSAELIEKNAELLRQSSASQAGGAKAVPTTKKKKKKKAASQKTVVKVVEVPAAPAAIGQMGPTQSAEQTLSTLREIAELENGHFATERARLIYDAFERGRKIARATHSSFSGRQILSLFADGFQAQNDIENQQEQDFQATVVQLVQLLEAGDSTVQYFFECLEKDNELRESEAFAEWRALNCESPPKDHGSADGAGGGGYSSDDTDSLARGLSPLQEEVHGPAFRQTGPVASGARRVALSMPVSECFAKLEEWEGDYLLVGGAVLSLLTGQPLCPGQDMDFALTPDDPKKLTAQGIQRSPYCASLFADKGLLNPMECFIVESQPGEPFFITDSQRRDFTIAALYCDKEGNIFDPTGRGLRDFGSRLLDTIIHPAQSFQDDPVRLLRALKYLMLGFSPSPGVDYALHNWMPVPHLNMPHLKAVTRKILRGQNALEFLRLLAHYNLLGKLFGLPGDAPVEWTHGQLREIVKFDTGMSGL